MAKAGAYEKVGAALEAALGDEGFREGAAALGAEAAQSAFADKWIRRLADPAGEGALEQARGEWRSAIEANDLARWIASRAALDALGVLPTMALPDDVEAQFLKKLAAAATVGLGRDAYLDPASGHPFRCLCAVILRERFPGGPFDWVMTGFPRSWLLKIPKADVARISAFLALKMGGFKPLASPHMSPLRRNPHLLVENETNRFYHRLARWIEPRPEIRGVLHTSWLFGPETARHSPHLAWLCDVPAEAGAVFSTLGPAEEDSGFLYGSEERRAAYEAGTFRPQTGFFLWSREHLLEWMRRRPELGPSEPR